MSLGALLVRTAGKLVLIDLAWGPGSTVIGVATPGQRKATPPVAPCSTISDFSVLSPARSTPFSSPICIATTQVGLLTPRHQMERELRVRPPSPMQITI